MEFKINPRRDISLENTGLCCMCSSCKTRQKCTGAKRGTAKVSNAVHAPIMKEQADESTEDTMV